MCFVGLIRCVRIRLLALNGKSEMGIFTLKFQKKSKIRKPKKAILFLSVFGLYRESYTDEMPIFLPFLLIFPLSVGEKADDFPITVIRGLEVEKWLPYIFLFHEVLFPHKFSYNIDIDTAKNS